ncbi:helix-turn-helix domain-containing protein [Paenibacillus odorifer]|nr:helix-turn-helix transcriptional regulator [Paenibacillus odorifer]
MIKGTVIDMIKVKLSELMGLNKVKSFAALEKETNITRKTLAKLYDGEGKGIDYDTLNKLCNYFNCEVSDILEYVKD